MLYSESTRGFYIESVHVDIPNDAVQITKEHYAELMQARAEPKVIVTDDSGLPVLADPQAPVLTEDAARARRDALLRACDWVTLRALETGDPVPAEWAAYRQALRDVPQQAGFPAEIEWPIAPEQEPQP